MTDFNAQAIKAALEQAGLTDVEIGPSNVTLSPYDYVFVWLTPQRYEGPHAIVSDLREYEDRDGFIVGIHESFEGDHSAIEYVPTQHEAVCETMSMVWHRRRTL